MSEGGRLGVEVDAEVDRSRCFSAEWYDFFLVEFEGDLLYQPASIG